MTNLKQVADFLLGVKIFRGQEHIQLAIDIAYGCGYDIWQENATSGDYTCEYRTESYTHKSLLQALMYVYQKYYNHETDWTIFEQFVWEINDKGVFQKLL